MTLFELHNRDCPWYATNDKCDGKRYYNGHVNNMLRGTCEEHTCPIVFWTTRTVDAMYRGVFDGQG